MKKATFRNLAMIALAAIMMSSVCAQAQILGVRGSGNVITEDRQVGDFTVIEVVGSADVVIRQGDETRVQVNADKNLLEFITTKVRNGTLVVGGEGRVRNYKKFEVHVTIARLDRVKIMGSGDVRSEGTLSGSDLEIAIYGSGDVNMQLDHKSLTTNINGSGDINVSGIAGSLAVSVMGSGDFMASDLRLEKCTLKLMGSGDLKLSGRASLVEIESFASGDINLHNLTAGDVEARIFGSGDIVINVSGNLKARLMGSGDLTYRGDPVSVDVSSMGSGSVYRR